MKSMAVNQHGISLTGFLMAAVGIILVGIMGLKVVPPYIHSFQIAQILKTIAKDPAMQGASIKEIRDSFSKRAGINYITDISPEEIEIAKDGAYLSLSVSYTVRIPLFANMTLVLDFNPSSS
jgi:hypothetical protein